MQYDVGLTGLAILAGLSLLFGLVVQFAGRAESRWLWLASAIGWFIGGLIASEYVVGAMTEGEIQPIVDGLAFDEALLGGLIVGTATAIAARYLTGSAPFRSHHPAPVASSQPRV